MSDVALRRVVDDDREFLRAVYASTRQEELAVVPWDGATRDAFIAQQFDAQDAYWRAQTPDAQFCVVLVDGEPAGRLYVDRRAAEIRIVDLALLPRFRGRGVGSRLLGDLVSESEVSGIPLTMHVERTNRAQRLYTRLGFEPIEDRGVYLFLTRPAGVS
jgi:ribosomal protein S18 acetylase RimI-like enzyme